MYVCIHTYYNIYAHIIIIIILNVCIYIMCIILHAVFYTHGACANKIKKHFTRKLEFPPTRTEWKKNLTYTVFENEIVQMSSHRDSMQS